MKLTNWEKSILNHYFNNYNAKWVRVFNNKHPIFDTTVEFYTIYKKRIKEQPPTSQETYTNMFRNLNEGEWYFISNILNKSKEDI